MNSTALDEDDIACTARGIADFASLKHWVNGPLRAWLPHEAMMCGQSVAHSGGYAALQRWATGVPEAYQASISCVGSNVRSPILTRAIGTGSPVFFEADRDGKDVPPRWLSNFRDAHWHNVLVLMHREGEDEELLRTSASFYNVPPNIEPQGSRLQEMVMPHLHAALSRIHRSKTSAPNPATTQPVTLTPMGYNTLVGDMGVALSGG